MGLGTYGIILSFSVSLFIAAALFLYFSCAPHAGRDVLCFNVRCMKIIAIFVR